MRHVVVRFPYKMGSKIAWNNAGKILYPNSEASDSRDISERTVLMMLTKKEGLLVRPLRISKASANATT